MDWTDWLTEQRQRLATSPVTGYTKDQPPAAEPTAIAGLASISHTWVEPGLAAAKSLSHAQLSDGSVGVHLDDQGPFWTTGLAVLVWRLFRNAWPDSASEDQFRRAEERGIAYLLSAHGEKIDYSENVGHDTQLVGWPWVLGTHSWVEPTSFAVLALRHAGFDTHPRTLEACQLLADRWLPDGGANYGNTFVLGQQLRPHILPSAVSGLALSRCRPEPTGMAATLGYLEQELTRPMGSVSLSWSVLALLAADTRPEQQDALEQALWRGIEGLNARRVTDHQLNMLTLAASLRSSPLLAMDELALADALETESR